MLKMKKAFIHHMDGPNVGHFEDGRFVQGCWAIMRFTNGVFKNWETFNTEAEALSAKDRWEKEGRI